jgi:RimJ/RimL family protein N-acetyltransferase/catechol 2,3-dioxygenase-like lactoylglutathione lyase family enzyme
VTGPPTLHTPRLTLRPIGESDTGTIVDLFADPELSRYLESNLDDPDEARAWFGRKLAKPGVGGTGDWIFDLAGETVGLGRVKRSGELPGGLLECGFYLAREYWGAGLATEATSAMIRHAFTTVGAPAVFAIIHEHNEHSLALAARVGFLDVGTGIHFGSVHRILVALPATTGHLHHVELWVPDLAATEDSWGWLLTELGWTEHQRWQHGVSWRLGPTYLVFEDSPGRRAAEHDRLRPGLNHIALHAGTPERVDTLVKAAARHGWRLLFADRHPHAGGPDHYAAYLENADGYEVELVAR